MTPTGQLTSLGSGISPTDVAVSPDGNRLYVVNHVYQNGSLHSSVSVLDIDSSGNYTVADTIAVPDSATAVALSPDGTRAYVSHTVPGTITVIDTGTNDVIGTVTADTDAVGDGSADGVPDTIAVGPDGRLYFTDSSDNTVHVVTVGDPTML